MDYSIELYIWMLNVLFIIGIMLLFVGAGFIFIPDKIFKLAVRANHWVDTDSFFHKLNKPRYKEHFFYRHHRIFGITIIIASIASLYTLTFYIGVESVTHVLTRIAESEFEKWLFVVLYYLLIGANILAVIFGAIMFKRPSALKTFEEWSNQWIDTDSPLKALDRQKHLPDRILPGNPRIFGLVIILGAMYIIWNTNPL